MQSSRICCPRGPHPTRLSCPRRPACRLPMQACLAVACCLAAVAPAAARAHTQLRADCRAASDGRVDWVSVVLPCLVSGARCCHAWYQVRSAAMPGTRCAVLAAASLLVSVCSTRGGLKRAMRAHPVASGCSSRCCVAWCLVAPLITPAPSHVDAPTIAAGQATRGSGCRF